MIIPKTIPETNEDHRCPWMSDLMVDVVFFCVAPPLVPGGTDIASWYVTSPASD